MAQVFRDSIGDNRPASKLVEVSALADPRLRVEIKCQAHINSGSRRPETTQILDLTMQR